MRIRPGDILRSVYHGFVFHFSKKALCIFSILERTINVV